MDNSELIDLLERCLNELAINGSTVEADRIRQGIEEAKAQLKQPYPCVRLLAGLCEASAAGKPMDRYSDADVVALWVAADQAVRQPHVAGGPDDMMLAHSETVTEVGAWVQARRRFEPPIGAVLQVWTPAPKKED